MNKIQLTSLVHELVAVPLADFQKIIRARSGYFGWIFNYFQSQSEVDVHQIIYKIKNLINAYPSVLRESTFIIDSLQLVNKLDEHTYELLKKEPTFENKHTLSLEKHLLTFIAGDQTKSAEVVSLITSRLNPINIICYLIRSSFCQNTTLATACCSYLDKHNIDISKHITTHPKDAFHALNAACLAKNDCVAQKSLRTILHQNLQIFKADHQSIQAFDYLIDKEEFCDVTLLVGNLQSPKRSSYFKALLQSISLDRSPSMILLKDMDHTAKEISIDYQGFLYVLRYIYTRRDDVPLEMCPIVGHLADIYLEQDLKKLCDQRVEQNVHLLY